MSSPKPSGMSFSTTVITPWVAMTASMGLTVVVGCVYGVDEEGVLELDDGGSLVAVVDDGVVEFVDESGFVVVVAGTVVVVVVVDDVLVVVVVVVVVASTIRCPNNFI